MITIKARELRWIKVKAETWEEWAHVAIWTGFSYWRSNTVVDDPEKRLHYRISKIKYANKGIVASMWMGKSEHKLNNNIQPGTPAAPVTNAKKYCQNHYNNFIKSNFGALEMR